MDIKAKVNYALEGKFKVDIYNKQGNLIESTDWFNNFITPTGLSHVYTYNFADCFRFLSIGSSSAGNVGNKDGVTQSTTGLTTPISQITTSLDPVAISGWPGVATGLPYISTSNKLSGTYMGPWAYSLGDGGMSEDAIGPRYYRSWRVPYYDGTLDRATYGDAGLTINEFMVSPFNSGNGALAFSRVVRTVIIPSDTYAYVSYQLGIRLASNTIKYFGPNTFTTGNADVTNEVAEVGTWANLSGYYRQTYHGLCWMDIDGQSFISKYGNAMEPSFTGLVNSRFYLSPDNSMFDTSLKGALTITEQDAYSADGLMGFVVENPYQATISANTTQNSKDKVVLPTTLQTYPSARKLAANIRIAEDSDVAPATKFPVIANYKLLGNTTSINYLNITPLDFQTVSIATPGVSGYDSNSVNFGNQIIVSTKGFNLPINTGLVTGRTRVLTRRHSFMPSHSLGKNTRYGSLVYAYKNTSDSKYYPTIDCMFFDSSGQHTMAHYRQITGIYFTNRGSGIVDSVAYTVPQLDKPFIHRTFQGPGSGNLNVHPAIPTV